MEDLSLDPDASANFSDRDGLAALRSAWPELYALSKSTLFGAFATVTPEGAPHVTPIGSIVLHRSEPRGYYHPKFTAKLRRTLDAGGRFELLFVDTRLRRWLPALVRGRFDQLVAARLSGVALPRREATEEEAQRWRRRVRAVSWTRGYDLLWKEMRFVQELHFERLVPIRFGGMAHGARTSAEA
jgi:hypothetical protein